MNLLSNHLTTIIPLRNNWDEDDTIDGKSTSAKEAASRGDKSSNDNSSYADNELSENNESEFSANKKPKREEYAQRLRENGICTGTLMCCIFSTFSYSSTIVSYSIS